ncbi:Phosphotransferase enzyme family [Actinomyces bovis]|uniref:Phosphotransferase enzyme family n=1 Tax=Actinomyces bovis TaxID=1658 RepID=A0ABY1VKW8_9ACTO|nr:Phosphotransferase enzyme family [Actinomyces bovis]VEG54714.1 Phosphotransferase enzyme family [Actinomyces israelii]
MSDSSTPSANEAPTAGSVRAIAPTNRRRSALSLAALASVAVPGLNPSRLTTPQSDSQELRVVGVVDTAGRTWEVLEPHDDATGAALEAEAGVLRSIGRIADDGRLTFQVARVAGALRLSGTHIQVRTHLPGSPIDLNGLHPGPGLSSGLGRALGELHEMPVSVINEAGLPVYTADDVRLRWAKLLDVAERTGHLPAPLLSRWRQALRHAALWRFRPVVVHGDLAEENVLVAGGGVVGMRGFAQAHVGDPAEDLAWIYASVPLDCLDSIENGYDIARSEGVDKHLRDRAELVSELGLVRWLMHGVHSNNDTVIQDAVTMLGDLLEQVGDEPLVEEVEPRLAPVAAARVASPDDMTLDVAEVGLEEQEKSAPQTSADADRTEQLHQVAPPTEPIGVASHQPAFSQAPATEQLSQLSPAALAKPAKSAGASKQTGTSKPTGASKPAASSKPAAPAKAHKPAASSKAAAPAKASRPSVSMSPRLSASTIGLIDDLADEDILTSAPVE